MEIPKDWTFKSKSVADEFDSHVREQLPWYDMVSDAVCFLAKAHLPNNGFLYDIGASTGNMTKKLRAVISARNVSAISLEQTSEMVEKWNGCGAIIKCDAQEYDYEKCDVIVIFLTLMFIPVAHRNRFIESLKSKLNDGGAMIIVDKFQGSNYIDAVMAKHLLKQKVDHGATCEAVLQKEESLLGVQRPLKREDYHDFSTFFKFGAFEGIVYESKS